MLQIIDTIKLSEKQKQQLIRLKMKTGIENWNVLCRWALCMSLAENSSLPYEDIPSDSNVEMTWKVFAGEYSDVYLAILRNLYCQQHADFQDILFVDYVKLHLSRGISLYLNSLAK